MLGRAGSAAFLSDLGQLLHTADCITNSGIAGTQWATQSTGSKTKNTEGEEGPGLWGGVAASIAQQRAWDPAVLSNTLSLAEGLLEYTKTEGLTHSAALVASVSNTICQRHMEVKDGGVGSSAGRPTSCQPLVQQASLQQDRQQPWQVHERPTLKAAMRAVVWGFQAPGLEQSYADSNARYCTRLLNTW
jgi:hypothetical protein